MRRWRCVAPEARSSPVRATRMLAVAAIFVVPVLAVEAQPSTSRVDDAGTNPKIELLMGLQLVSPKTDSRSGYGGTVGEVTVSARWKLAPAIILRVFGMCIASQVSPHWLEAHRVSAAGASPEVWQLGTVSRRESERLLSIGATLGFERALPHELRLSGSAGGGGGPKHRYTWRSETSTGSGSAGGGLGIVALRLQRRRAFVEQQGILLIGRRDGGVDRQRVYLPLAVGVVF